MHKRMTLAEMAKEIHQNAVEKGFWPEDKEAAEVYALIHSEWSEALEEYRAGRPDRYLACGIDKEPCDLPDLCSKIIGIEGSEPCGWVITKPEGVCVELIDGVIRILDYMGSDEKLVYLGRRNVNMNNSSLDEIIEDMYTGLEKLVERIREYTVPMLVNQLHTETTFGWEAHGPKKSEHLNMIAAVGCVWQWIKGRGLDPMELLIEKHEYNVTRPYKHGKVC